jgi:hypothetical protein
LIEPSNEEDDNINYAENDNITCPLYVFNKCELFTDYRPMTNIYVGSVEGIKTCAYKKGIIQLVTNYKSIIAYNKIGGCTIYF